MATSTEVTGEGGATSQPPLPSDLDWPEETIRWWEAWGREPRTKVCTETDWLYLIQGAILHASAFAGDVGRINDLRAHVRTFEIMLAERGALAAPTKRKETPLDELARRREARESKAKNSSGPGSPVVKG